MTGLTSGLGLLPVIAAGQMPGLLRSARSLTSDRGRAEDLVQKTLARALQKRDQLRGQSSLATWLHRILRNLAVDTPLGATASCRPTCRRADVKACIRSMPWRSQREPRPAPGC
ncbi:hypothetical protein GA707_19205 [Nostocoides sp. F2B08]|uniref:RNA polymerase sigma factor n=1 Tax=Nostocoides sp. F2B08 TaxID=2653936 RepID=UPI001263310E|nr:RNA polymerase sigma factor [Tetrasphaera sp. F2B08]KAB7740626.1 hypothetical protein GA707_19205 [Tetrasphaera sp. F2B08]